MRLDAAIRIDATCDTFRLGDGGGLVLTRTIPHGLYLCAEDLAAEFEAWAQVEIDPGATVAAVAGYFVFTWPGDIVLEWPQPRLKTWLGFAVDVDAPSPQTAPSRCQGTFLPSLPWSVPSPLSWTLSLARSPTWRGQGRSILRGLHRSWGVLARATSAELAQFRSVLGQLLAGMPGRLWLDVDNADPWGSADPYGYVDVWLSPDSREYVERWLSLPARIAVEIDLSFAEYVTP